MQLIESTRDCDVRDTVRTARPLPPPARALMCPPDFFDVIDVKNPFMRGQAGHVDKTVAAEQWRLLRQALSECGIESEIAEPLPHCEDMVFCANQCLPGFNPNGERVCVPARMRYASRQPEVSAIQGWFQQRGYQSCALGGDVCFEAGGDALWHPRRRLLWGGYGFRSDRAAYGPISRVFDVPVVLLRLADERFYHLDTCLCLLDETSAMFVPDAFEQRGRDLLASVFATLIEVPVEEAVSGLACNALGGLGRKVLIERKNPRTLNLLRERGFHPTALDTSEFIKSGGSVYCLKTLFW